MMARILAARFNPRKRWPRLAMMTVYRWASYALPGQPQHIIQRGNNRQVIFAVLREAGRHDRLKRQAAARA